MERKWLNVELNAGKAAKFREFLKENSIRFESSGAWGMVHFEVIVDELDRVECDEFLSELEEIQ